MQAGTARGEEEAAGKLMSLAQELQSKFAAPMQQLIQQRQRVDREMQELQSQLEGDDDASKLPEVDAAIQTGEAELSALTASRDELMHKRTALADDKVKHGRRYVAGMLQQLKLQHCSARELHH